MNVGLKNSANPMKGVCNMKKIRTYKVTKGSGCGNADTPTLKIAGKWLRDLDIDIGDNVELYLSDDGIIIKKVGE